MSSISSNPQPVLGGGAAQPLMYGSPIGAGTAQGAGDGFSLADVVRVLKQRKLTIIITAVLVFALAVGATLLVKQYFPGWSSIAIFELDPPKEGIWITGEAKTMPQIMEQMLATEASKLKELQLLLDVMAKPEMKQTRYYDWYEKDAMKAATGLADDLSVGPIPNTRLIRLQLMTRSRTETRDIVRAVVDRYLAQFSESERSAAFTEKENITAALDKMKTELDTRRAEANAFRERTDSPAIEMERRVANNHMTILRAEVNAVETTVSSLQSQLDSIAGHDPDRIPLTAEQQLLVESDPQLRFYVSQVENMDIEIAVMRTRFGENHRNVQVMKQRRQGYYEKEIAKREELMTKVRQRQLEQLRQQSAQATKVLQRRQEQLDDALAKERDLDRSVQKYQQMVAEIEVLQRRIAELEDRRNEAEHRLNSTNQARLKLVQAPREAVEPARPNMLVYLGAGFVLAWAAGVGLAFLREFTDQTVRTPIDVVRHGHLSVLGTIPLLDDEEADVEEIEDAVMQAPQSLVAEAFRRTRTNLQFSGPAETQQRLLITSPAPGDGKTAVSINLAATMAHSGQRVLLVDCNFRRPELRRLFEVKSNEGLSNLLIGEGSLESLIAKTNLPNLDVLPSGPMPPTPAELLGSEAMRNLLNEAAKHYDRILLDGPPTLLISDATVLAMMVDGVIIVARADGNSKGVLKRTREALEKINARVVGAVLNGVRARPGGYFRQQYREFYDYSSDETIPPELPSPGELDNEDDD